MDEIDDILARIDEALARKGLSDAAASKLAAGNPSLIKNLRLSRATTPADRRTNFHALSKLADVLGLECYFGPPRDTGPVEHVMIDGADYAHIPLHDAHLAAGTGCDNSSEQVIEQLAFRRDWLRKVGINASVARLARVHGDSMMPTIAPGDIDQGTIIRISSISDGFPHYVHFISEKLFWRVYSANNGGKVTTELFDLAMEDAASAMDMKLRGPYDQATQKYNDTYSAILFAVADGHELKKSSKNIFEVYQDIMRQLGRAALDRPKYNSKMNSLKAASHAHILTGSRQGWYEFTEKMIRGYVRLKAEQAGVSLRPDHPSAPVVRG